MFAEINNLEDNDFKINRLRKKTMAGEITSDFIEISAKERYKTIVYFTVLDTIISSIFNKCNQSRNVLNDLSILSPGHIMLLNKENTSHTPDNALKETCKWFPNQDLNLLRKEYLVFSKSLFGLIGGLSPNYLHIHKNSSDACNGEIKLYNSNDEFTKSDNNNEFEFNKQKCNVLQIVKVLKSYGMIQALSNL